MKLFLSSQIEETADKFVELLDKKPDRLKLVFIPTAGYGHHDTEPSYVHSSRDVFTKLGFQVSDLDLRGVTEVDIERALKDADIVFVAGGNTFFLLQQIRICNFEEPLRRALERGLIYSGSSAGSCVVGPDIGPTALMDDPEDAPQLKSTKGLNLVDFLVIPHYKRSDFGPSADQVLEKYGDSVKMKTLMDHQAFWVEDGTVTLVESEKKNWF